MYVIVDFVCVLSVDSEFVSMDDMYHKAPRSPPDLLQQKLLIVCAARATNTAAHTHTHSAALATRVNIHHVLAAAVSTSGKTCCFG